MARAGVGAHSSSAAKEVAYNVENFEHQDLWWACQWDPTRPGYAWYLVHQDNGSWSAPGRPPLVGVLAGMVASL